jgi:drug/metabolite transporter (DMT)-like permease
MTESETKPTGIWQMIKNCSGTEMDRRNQYRFMAWSFAWALTYVAASWTLKSDRELATPLAWALVAVPTLLSIVAVFAYLRFLRMADELLRKIQLDGLATGFAAGLVYIIGYQLLEAIGASPLQSDNVVLVMVFGWMLGQFVGMWRYR